MKLRPYAVTKQRYLHMLFSRPTPRSRECPRPLRISGEVAAEALERSWGHRTIAPSADLLIALPRRLAAASIVGGSSYDALVALTAHEHGRPLVSLDLRAERTYRVLGIDFRLLG